MGAIADAIVAYAQPLLDQTDGSQEELKKAFAMTQLFYNLSLLPEDNREASLEELRQELDMDDTEFAAFRHELADPMIRRHQQMFPLMHQRRSAALSQNRSSPLSVLEMPEPAEKSPPTDRYAPCPCNSGRKFKFCCGAKRR